MASSLLLSAYEVAREKLIADNQAALVALGLVSATHTGPGGGSAGKVDSEGTKKPKPSLASAARAKRKANATPGARRSSRLQGVVRSVCMSTCLVTRDDLLHEH